MKWRGLKIYDFNKINAMGNINIGSIAFNRIFTHFSKSSNLRPSDKENQILCNFICGFEVKLRHLMQPVGSVLAFSGNNVPEDMAESWMICDGSELDKKKYELLYGIIGTTYGEGNSFNTFKIPDYRGLFLRGLNNGRKDNWKDQTQILKGKEKIGILSK